MLEVLTERLCGVQTVLAEGECAGGGRGPSIDQGHLHNVEAVAGVANERAPIGDVQVHVGAFIKMVSIIHVTITHDRVRDNGIDFNSGNTVTPICNRT